MKTLKKSTIVKMYRIDWGVIHLFSKFYLVKKYSPSTKGIKGKLWHIVFVKY